MAATNPVKTSASPLPAKTATDKASPEAPENLWERIRLDLSWNSVDSYRVDKARENLLQQPGYLDIVSDRADLYLYYIVEEVQKREMPVEIALIPVIESTMDPFASSHSGAAGLWQIMPGTGKHLGLEQNSSYDGRQALQDSTSGALDYLQSLYEEFDEDWLLALAAYNAGAGNIARAQQANEKKGLDTDYWSLNLPRQAHNYVPKVIALAQILATPEEFDVDIPDVENAPSFEAIDIEVPLDFTKAAQLAGVDVDTLRALNPGSLTESIALSQEAELLLPYGTRNRFEHNISNLTPEELVQWKTYRIKPGDSLGKIAEKFDMEVAALREVNSIHGSNIRAGDTLKIPRDSSPDPERPDGLDRNAIPKDYQVRKGDSLNRIAHKFKVSVSDIISWNALDPGSYLHPGQMLILYITRG